MRVCKFARCPQVHELRLEMVGLQAKFSSVSAEESASRAKLAELRNEKKMVEEDLARRTHDMKRTIEAVEEQLRAAKVRERDLLAERESAAKSFHASLSVRNEDMERMKRAITDAENRSDSLTQELNALRQQMQVQRSREQEMEDSLRAVRRDLLDERSSNRAGQEQLLSMVSLFVFQWWVFFQRWVFSSFNGESSFEDEYFPFFQWRVFFQR